MFCFSRLFLAFAFCATAISGCDRASQRLEAPADVVAAPPAPEEDISVDLWLEQLEVGSRELYAAREDVAAAVGLDLGVQVADIGAGTGLYTLLFAELVGVSGHVFAVDIEPLFLDLINQRTSDSGFENVTAVLGQEDDITLPENSIDIAFIADTYHYFSDREAIMKTVYDALKPGGTLVMVEYDIIPGEPRPEGKSHVRFGKDAVIAEVEFVGFRFLGEIEVEGLNDNYFVRFSKS